jgi:flagellar biosynthesis/type III secretory pathway M-ring protein FliF/YscJ
MFKPEMLKLLAGVISSWQVIAVTIALVFYFMLVFYVARPHHRSGAFSLVPKKKKQKPEKVPETEISEEESDDLGLEEE